MKNAIWWVGVFIFVGPLSVRADDALWDGASGNWSDDAHWSTDVYPDNDDPTFFDVFISTSTVTQDVETGLTFDGVVVDSLTWSGGTLAGDNPVTVLNTIAWTNGQLSNTAGLNVAPTATLTYTGTGTQHKLNDNAVLNIDGTVVLDDGAQFNTGAAVADPATVNINAGATFDIRGNGALTDTFFDNASVMFAGTVQNSGLFTKSSGSNTNIRNITDDWTLNNLADGTVAVEAGTLFFSPSGNGLNNNGLVDVQAGLLQIGGGTSSGTFQVADGATLRVSTSSSPSIVHVFDGATIDNAGTLELNGRVQFVGGSSVTGTLAASLSSNTAELGGTDPLAFDSLTWTGGSLANSAGVTINTGGNLAISDSGTKRLADNASLTIAGNATLSGSQSIENRAAAPTPSTIHVDATGLLDIQTDIGLSEQSAANAGTLQIDGTLRKSDGIGVSQVAGGWSVENNGSIEVQSGTLRLFADLVHNGMVDLEGGDIEFRGDVAGTGNFTGTGKTTFRGDYRPGASAAEILFDGDVEFDTAAAKLFIELGGTTLGTDYDALSITGALALEGSLRVSFAEVNEQLYGPSEGDTFSILSAAGGITGEMMMFLPTLTAPDLSWEVLESETSLALRVSREDVGGSSAGDYNGDGVVEAADYTVWRDLSGQTGPDLPADGTGPAGVPDGVVDLLDYALWVAHFGETAPMGAASAEGLASFQVVIVPELATPALLPFAIAMLCAMVGRQRCRGQ